MSLNDYITQRFNLLIPKVAIELRTDMRAVYYRHPTRGWKRVSWKRVGVKPYDVQGPSS